MQIIYLLTDGQQEFNFLPAEGVASAVAVVSFLLIPPVLPST